MFMFTLQPLRMSSVFSPFLSYVPPQTHPHCSVFPRFGAPFAGAPSGLDQGIGHSSSMNPQKNERLTPNKS
jgi:hypothetical protein